MRGTASFSRCTVTNVWNGYNPIYSLLILFILYDEIFPLMTEIAIFEWNNV